MAEGETFGREYARMNANFGAIKGQAVRAALSRTALGDSSKQPPRTLRVVGRRLGGGRGWRRGRRVGRAG